MTFEISKIVSFIMDNTVYKYAHEKITLLSVVYALLLKLKTLSYLYTAKLVSNLPDRMAYPHIIKKKTVYTNN